METKELIFKAYEKYQALEIAAMSLKVGDSVKIRAAATTNEMGWDNSWQLEMNPFIGRCYTITDIFPTKRIKLSCGFTFPIFVLEKCVEKDSIDVNGVKFENNGEKTLKAFYKGGEYQVSKKFIEECGKFLKSCSSPVPMFFKFGCVEFTSKDIQQVRNFFKF